MITYVKNFYNIYQTKGSKNGINSIFVYITKNGCSPKMIVERSYIFLTEFFSLAFCGLLQIIL